jgi:hypothetical protein
MGNEGDEQQELNNEHAAQANVQVNNLDPPVDDLLLDDDEREELQQQQQQQPLQQQLLLQQLLQQQQPCQHEDQQDVGDSYANPSTAADHGPDERTVETTIR